MRRYYQEVTTSAGKVLNCYATEQTTQFAIADLQIADRVL
jgi:hypothetical protein